MRRKPAKNPDDEEFFEYLDELRESGRANMWGAGTYLQLELGMSKDEAKRVVLEWMAAFNNDTEA